MPEGKSSRAKVWMVEEEGGYRSLRPLSWACKYSTRPQGSRTLLWVEDNFPDSTKDSGWDRPRSWKGERGEGVALRPGGTTPQRNASAASEGISTQATSLLHQSPAKKGCPLVLLHR